MSQLGHKRILRKVRAISGSNVRFGSKADICSAQVDVRFTPNSGHVRCNSQCPLCANSGHPRNDLPKQKGRLAAAFPKSDGLRLLLPSGLNNWGFALADRSFAFADTTSEAKGQYD